MWILMAGQAPKVLNTHYGIQFPFIARGKKHVEKTDKT